MILPQEVLHEDFEVLICKMPEMLKEFPCQGEILRHLEVLRMIKPNPCIRINEATSGMLLQKLLPKLKCFIWRCNDFNLILKISYLPD
jgi:hypothetical protein